MNTLVAIYQSVPADVWPLILAPLVAAIVELLKRWLGVKKSALVIHSLTATTATLTTMLPALIAHADKPPAYLAAYSGIIFTGANFVYALVKALTPFWAAVKKYEDKKAADHDALIDPTTATVSSVTAPAVTKIDVDQYEG